MAPKKRKASSEDLSADHRRRKIVKRDKNAPDDGDTLPPEGPSKSTNSTKGAKASETKTIQWILPRNAKNNTKEAFAPILFQQPLQRLRNRRRAVFDRPQLPSPIHTKEQGDIFEAQKDRRLDKFRITNELCKSHDLVWSKNNDYIGDVVDKNVSLIGLPGDDRVLLLAGDDEGTLNVTLQHHPSEEEEHAVEPEKVTKTASIRIIRRTGHGDISELFLVLPPNGLVWVNNKDFPNTTTEDDSSDQYIGPLGEFAIVELLHAPIFLWRNRTDILSNKTAAIPSKRSKVRNPLPEGMIAKVTFNRPGANTSNESRSSNRPGSEDDLHMTGGTESRVGRENEHVQEGLEQGALAALEDIINPVILAVSSLQKGQNEGFSVDIDGILIRPGRPWIFPLRLFCATVLAIMQFVESDNDRRITIHILDPMQHNPNQSARGHIWHAATGSDTLQHWLTGLGLDLEEIKTVLPNNAYWVDSPEGLDDHEAYAITALNAWVLAMGLNLNPDWKPPDTGSGGNGTPTGHVLYSRSVFFQEADRLISLARSGSNLDWEILYQFFREQNYVIDNGPPQENRRFNLETVGTPDFKNSQLNAQSQEAAQLKAYRLAEDGMNRIRAARESVFAQTNDLRVNFTDSKRIHSETFPSKEAAEKFDPCWHLQTRLEQLGQSYQSGALLDHTDINLDRIFSSVSAVSQAIAHTAGYAADFECIDYTDNNFPRKLPYSGSRLLLLPYVLDCSYLQTSNGHQVNRDVLVVIQPLPNGSGRTFTIHVFDHAPWLYSRDLRRSAYESLRKHLMELTGCENIEIKGDDISWVVDPPPCGLELWQLSYYTILNAWSICLGLHMNQDFRAEEGFFEQAAQIARLVRDGLADWKLIWSFLRCKKFVIKEQVPVSRQFTRTIAERELDKNLNQLRQKFSFPPPIEDTAIYKFPETHSHFPTDTWEPFNYDSVTHDIAPLLRAGRSIAGLDAGGLSEEARKEGKRRDDSRAHEERPKDPCKAFNEEFQPLCKTHIEDINSIRSILNNGREATNTHLLGDYVNLTIASVLLAINKTEDIYNGMCCIDPKLVDYVCSMYSDGLTELLSELILEYLPHLRDRKPIRFSRPMIFSITHHNHIVLMVIQYDEEQSIKLTVLDSSPWHYEKYRRNVIHHIGSGLLEISQWRDLSYHQLSGGREENLDHTTWVPCAIQSTHYTCGYHTIYNGWAAALGLRLNPRFSKVWTPGFLDQAQNLICLAMLGQASSEMIHNYLECIDFVLPKQVVDMSLRFQNTVKTDETTDATDETTLHSTMDEMLQTQEAFWMSFNEGEERDQAIKKISQENRVHFLSGNSRRHDADWNADTWPKPIEEMNEIVKAHQGKIYVGDFDLGQLTYHAIMYANKSVETMKDVCIGFRRYYERVSAAGSRSGVRLFHDYIQIDSMEPIFIEEKPVNVGSQHFWYLDKLLQKKDTLQDTRHPNFFSLVVEASAAIVQAIDEKQQRQSGHLFTSGFTLATRFAIQTARSGELGIATRPRRCWLMPFQFPKDQNPLVKHYFLAVLQEEKANTESGSEFRVYFFDSDPGGWTNDTEAKRIQAFDQVKTIAHNLQWTKHRNIGARVQFCTKPKYVQVTKQKGDDRSGYHTILNVWILSLGMTPKIKPIFEMDGIYPELIRMTEIAIRGWLDWRTLVAWLFMCDLTVEKTIGPVTLERAFDVSALQVTNVSLRGYVNNTNPQDDLLGTRIEEDAPYIHNNVDFSRDTWQFEEEEHEQDASEPHVLHRALEDIDMLDRTGNEDDWSSFFTELTQTAYNDLRFN